MDFRPGSYADAGSGVSADATTRAQYGADCLLRIERHANLALTASGYHDGVSWLGWNGATQRMDIVKRILMGLGCVGLLWLGSCTVMGVTGIVALNGIMSEENISRMENEIDERELEAHNKAMNDEAGLYESRFDDQGSVEE